MNMRAKASSTTDGVDPYRDLRMDMSTHSLQVIDYAHHEIHAGSSFHAEYSVTTANTDDHRTGILFKTPATTKYAHMVITVSATGAAEAIINEAPTLGAPTAGSDTAIYNRNRNSTKTSTLQSLEGTPTVGSLTKAIETEMGNLTISAGTELEHLFLAAGTGPKPLGGVSRGQQEWILKANTIYLIYLINTGASANTHYVGVDWYEHTDKT